MNLLQSIIFWVFITQFLFLSCKLLIDQTPVEEENLILQNNSDLVNNTPTDEILQNILEILKLPTINSSMISEIMFTQTSYNYSMPFDVDRFYSNFIFSTDIMAIPVEKNFRYSIVQNNDTGYFDIDENTATLSVNTISGTVASYSFIQPCSNYSFDVQATDISNNQTTSTTINISFTTDPMWNADTSCSHSDYSPTFKNTSLKISIFSNTSLHASNSFYSVYAEDLDQGDQLTYSLSGDNSSLFTIGPQNAVLSYIDPIDIVDNKNLSLIVSATDTEGNSDSRLVIVQVGEPYQIPIDIFVIRGPEDSQHIYDCHGTCPQSNNSTLVTSYIIENFENANLLYNDLANFNRSNIRIQFVEHPTEYNPINTSTTLSNTIYFGDSAITYRTMYSFTPTDISGIPNGEPPFQINYSSSRIPIILTKTIDTITTGNTPIKCAYNVVNVRNMDYSYIRGSLIVIGGDSVCNFKENIAHELGHFWFLSHSFDNTEEKRSCMFQEKGTTNRIMDYSAMDQTVFLPCEKNNILKNMYSFFLIKTQYEHLRASYNRQILKPNSQ